MTTEYLSCTETAKLLRKALARDFPGVKFSVRSHVYSGGASIDVSWTDGPISRDVEATANAFSGGGFDGMIDMKYSSESWLEDDGSATFAHTRGTGGSMGSVPEAFGSRRTPGARLVYFDADFVFCHRKISDEVTKRAEAAAWIRAHCALDGEAPNDRFGNMWVNDMATNLVYKTREGETTAEAFERGAYHNGR